MAFAAGAGAIWIGAVVAASSILAGGGMEVVIFRGAAVAPASFRAGGGEVGGGLDGGVKVEVEMEVEVGGGGGGGGRIAAVGALVGATAIFGATAAGASAGSWSWPSLIWEIMFARARGRRASKR